MTRWEREELAKALIYIGVRDKGILRIFSDFEGFSEEETKKQLAMLRSR